MKTKNVLLKVLLSILIIVPFFISCSSSDDGDSNNGSNVTSIVLSANPTTILQGESVSFTVTDNLGSILTSSAQFEIDGTTISNPYVFTSSGSFNVVASYDSFTSNSVSINVVAPATSITISSDVDSAIIETQETFTFSVIGDNNVDYSNSSTIYVNNVAINGYVYTPTGIGDLDIYAESGNLTSNVISVEAISGVNEIFIDMDIPEVKINETINFSATDNLSTDITASSTFYVDGVAIPGSSYSPDTVGSYDVYATYTSLNGDLQSATSSFDVYRFTQKVLVEDYTGTWCGYCPRLAYNLEQAEDQNSAVIGVGIHDDDDMPYEYIGQMASQYGITGFPSGRINRNIEWNESVDQVFSYTGSNPGLGLAINSSLAGNTISVDVKIGYDMATTNNKLVVYLLEDGLIYPQVNYYNNDASSPWYQMGDPIQDFEHNNVLRKAFTDIFGDTVPNGVAQGEYSTSYSLTIPASVQDTSKLEIVAFLLNSSGRAVNVQHAALGVNQDFD